MRNTPGPRAAPASVTHTEGEGGLPKVVLRALDGAVAEIYAHGAHVTSWRPSPDGDERLFLSAQSEFRDGAAIRGGIPIVFPQFAAEGPLPKHGFARTSTWTFAGADAEPSGEMVASFTLADSSATRALWPASFLLTLEVRVGGAQLRVALSVENTGATTFAFTAALHTYLRVHDVRAARLVGLHGAQYRQSAQLHFDRAEAIAVDGETDRVYLGAPSRLTLREPVRQLSLETAGFPDVVVWNPGDRVAALKDMEPGGERRMLCVEAAAVKTPVRLDAGRRWRGSQTLTAQPREH